MAFQPDVSREQAVALAVGALVAAADEDTATGGPDLISGILPNVFAIDVGGLETVDEDVIRSAAQEAIGGQTR
jgi:proteasome beta subunit